MDCVVVDSLATTTAQSPNNGVFHHSNHHHNGLHNIHIFDNYILIHIDDSVHHYFFKLNDNPINNDIR